MITYSVCVCVCYISAAEDDEMGPDGKKIRPGISSDIIAELTDCNARLSQQRKKRQVLYVRIRNLKLLREDDNNIFILH